jgi:pectinesterase
MKPKWGWRMSAAVALMGCGMVWAQGRKTITVGAAGADFTTIQAAVNAAPDVGAVIRIRPGVYREVVHVDKPKIELRGEGDDWTKVVLAYGNSAASTCGTSCSAILFVTGSYFFARNMTIANDYSTTSDVPSQAVALSVRADRAVLRHVRLLGAQDTLYASSMGCMKEGSECRTGNVRALDSSDDSDDSIHLGKLARNFPKEESLPYERFRR